MKVLIPHSNLSFPFVQSLLVRARARAHICVCKLWTFLIHYIHRCSDKSSNQFAGIFHSFKCQPISFFYSFLCTFITFICSLIECSAVRMIDHRPFFMICPPFRTQNHWRGDSCWEKVELNSVKCRPLNALKCQASEWRSAITGWSERKCVCEKEKEKERKMRKHSIEMKCIPLLVFNQEKHFDCISHCIGRRRAIRIFLSF